MKQETKELHIGRTEYHSIYENEQHNLLCDQMERDSISGIHS